MSVADEILRLQQAKSDLATSIAAKGVTVPAATTLDGYAALVDQIQQGGSSLPYDTEIEYIESTGTQYINSRYCPNTNTKVEAKVMYSHPGTIGATNYMHFMYGVRETINGTTYRCDFLFNYYGNTTTKHYPIYQNFGKQSSEPYEHNYRDTAIEISNSIDGGYIDNVLLFPSRDATPFQCTQPMYILWCNDDGTGQSNRPPYGRIYYFKIYESGVLLHSFIPVRIGNVGYLYDNVSGKFIGNAGSGAFILGPDVT